LRITGPITQVVGTTLTAGKWTAWTTATLDLASAPTLTVNQADVTTSGTASIPQMAGLTTNSGILNLHFTSRFATAGNLTNTGEIHLYNNSLFRINGNYTQTGTGLLDFSTYDFANAYNRGSQLVVTGNANIAGALTIYYNHLQGPTAPEPPTGFIAASLTAANITGSFSPIDTDRGVDWWMIQTNTPTSITARVVRNTAPRLDPIADVTLKAGTTATVTPTFTDPDAGQVHTFALQGAPSWVTINRNTGLITVAPPVGVGNVVTEPIRVWIGDGGDPVLLDATTFRVNVQAVNTAPRIDPIGLKTLPEGSTISFQVKATDPDPGQQLIHVMLPMTPPAGSIHPLTGVATYTAAVAPGWYTGGVLVADTGTPQLYDIATFGIEVTNVAPTMALPVATEARRGQVVGVPGSFSDPGQGPWTLVINYGDGSPLEFAPTWSKNFVVGHTYATRGTYPLTVAVWDSFGGVDMKISTVTVGFGTTTVSATAPVTAVGGVTNLVIAFVDPMNVGRVQSTGLYDVRTAGQDGRFDTADDQIITVRSATWVPDGRAVVLTFGAPIPTTSAYRVRARATSPATDLVNALGQLLDGDSNDTPGGDFVRIF
jgi:hypothetical protein